MIHFVRWVFWSVVGCIGFLLSTVLADCIYCLFYTPKWWGKNTALAYVSAAMLVYLFLCVGASGGLFGGPSVGGWRSAL